MPLDNASARSLIWTGLCNVAVRALETERSNWYSIASGKHVRTPWNTYPLRIDACKSEDVGRDEGEADPYQRRVGGSESTRHGNASYVTSRQAGEKRRGCPGQGLRGGTLAAEHACSTPWSKWRAQTQTVPAPPKA